MAALYVIGQILLLRSLDDPPFFSKYWSLAADLLNGTLSHDRLNDVSPLYLWATALIRALDLPVEVLRGIQFAAGGIVVGLAAAIAHRLSGALAAIVTLLLLVGNKAIFLNASELEPEALILLLNTTALFFLLGRDRTPRNVLMGGVVFGLSAITRPVVLPGAVLVLLCLLARPDDAAERNVPRWRAVSLYGVGLVAPLLLAVGITWALTGHGSIMNPGTVFYEGMNPHATGYTSSEPLIVSDVRAEVDQPDPLHYAYRLVAARVKGTELSPETSNRYWTGKAFAFVREKPDLALRLVLRKAGFAIHSFDAWDIVGVVVRDRSIEYLPWIPLGLLIGLAAVAVFERRDDPRILALLLFILTYVAVMAAFYVSSRQRNAMVSAVAILAGVGLARIVATIRSGDRARGAMWAIAVLMVAVLLTIEGPWQQENRYGWTASLRSEVLVQQRQEADKEGDSEEAARMRAIDRTWLMGDDPHIPSAPRPLVGAIAKGELSHADSPQRMFDLALALQYAQEWDVADRILRALEEHEYRPIRTTLAVDSVAWYRVLAHLHLGDRDAAKRELGRALEDAPADPLVLSLVYLLENDQAARDLLFEIHDPFTAELALARGHYELGNLREAKRLAAKVHGEIPEWNRARLLDEYLGDLLQASEERRRHQPSR